MEPRTLQETIDDMRGYIRRKTPDPSIPPGTAPDKLERLKMVKLILEIALAIITLIGGTMALIWGTR
jgi:hypothetical protein